jgi:hypothetical protein
MGRQGFIISSGFLLPTKSTGAISFVDSDTGTVTKLTHDKKGFFYHRARFIDISQTGRLDIITARGHISPFSANDGELVWLKRPQNPISDDWQEVVLTKGPDIHFRILKTSSLDLTFVVAAEFSKQQLELFWISKDGNLGSRVIDSTLGNPFDVDFADLNHDGKLDMLVTNHQHDNKASVFAYEIPLDLKNGPWIRHTLLEGVQTRQKGFNQASPGVAKAFYPEIKESNSNKPWILVSGDGSQRVHLLTPLSEMASDWTYKEEIILDTKSTVGEPLIYDFDGDGLSDFVIPAYDADKLYLMSIKR